MTTSVYKNEDNVTLETLYNTFVIAKNKATDASKIDLSIYKLYTPVSTPSIRDNKYDLSALKRNIKILEGLKKLQYNWNYNEANSFDEKLINKVIDLVKIIPYQPQIFPTANNSIEFEFTNKNEDYLEFEIFEDEVLCLIDKHGKIQESVLDEESINSIIEDFYA